MFVAKPFLVIYLIVGPLAWVLFAIAMMMAYGRMNRFRRPRSPLPDPPPAVTILIPAKDEGDEIRQCLQGVLAQDYPKFNVICVDDRSTDETGVIMDEFAAAHPQRLRAIHIPTNGLPPGWLGKCNALHAASAHSTGEWLLFVDSDVKLEADALSTALSLAAGRNYDAVSILTRLETHNFIERLVLPLAAASVGAITLMSLTNDDRFKRVAFANGQFFLIRRSAYDHVGGHKAVRDNITEDVALMRILKLAGHRVRLYYGRDFASTRMHATLRQIFNGWARIFSGVTARRLLPIVIAMLVVAFSSLSAYPALVYAIIRQDALWLAATVTHFLVMTASLAWIYHMSGNPRRYALAFPVAGPILLAIYVAALRACRTGTIAWRGTNYTAASAKP